MRLVEAQPQRNNASDWTNYIEHIKGHQRRRQDAVMRGWSGKQDRRQGDSDGTSAFAAKRVCRGIQKTKSPVGPCTFSVIKGGRN